MVVWYAMEGIALLLMGGLYSEIFQACFIFEGGLFLYEGGWGLGPGFFSLVGV